ncbi:probable LRR receptor-like serine/threonine-protein kinase At2g16250 [Elaeis guineensis]|uniref:Probable LRR receptor-like serine/threonine-protein kinase At2g16250 n=1 Tax=Elaeis guineensis var. tenera TaxID=51953 RepID=A0A6I9SAP9_ELAGV|nr:probable LRR receptor-like serine/threonine-protein kinase At2g16250 [Elaeis guineensis]
MPSPLVPFVLVLLAGVFFSPALGQNLTSTADLAGLYSLRASLGLRARDWPRRTDPCSAWTGVGCRAGRVVSLNISGLRRTRLGQLNPQFAVDGLQNLSRLESFNATGFPLPGSIPDWFGRGLPPGFSTLDLSDAAVSGPIPYSLGNATGLAVLSLAGNAISGNIPPTLGQLSNLSVLDLSHNSLSGAIPPSLASLSNLSYLDLSSNFLTGPIPLAFGTLSKLNTLILSNNSLTGSVPPQLGDLSSLASLDLSFNSLAGALPDDLKDLRSLRDLNFGNNSLSGLVAGSLFSGLSRLRSVTLSHNNFSGALPDSLWSLSELRFLDVSYNNLTGTLPDLVPAVANANASGAVFNLSNNLFYGSISTGFAVVFTRFNVADISDNYFQGALPVDGRSKNFSFGSNCFRNASNQRTSIDCEDFYSQRGLPYDGPVTPGIALAPTSSSAGKSNRNLKYILIGVIGGLLLIVILVLAIVLGVMRCGARKPEQRKSSGNAEPSGAQPTAVSVNLSAVGEAYTYEQLVRATAEFSGMNLIKRGRTGDLYHGVLEDGIPVVVKRIDVRTVRKEAHVVELELFSRGLHERLVPFLGHCLDNENEKLLVYKYVPNGDLSNALHRKSGQEEGLQSLDWIKRLKIAIGVAEALCYLHHECVPPLVHRDIQASSILLDDKFEVRLGSLSEVCTQEGEGHQTVITRILRLSQTSEQGISGSSTATCAYDVYCLGKVLLELVTGKLGVSGSNDAATNEWIEQTLRYINIYEKEPITKIVDPSLIVDEDHLEEVWAMAIVAKSCLNPKPSKRPLMRYILKALENPLKVVREDNNSGSARLRATSSRGSWNAAFFGSWRHSSSDIASIPVPPREEQILKRSGTSRSQGSGGESSFSHKRPSREIFPEPSGAHDTED